MTNQQRQGPASGALAAAQRIVTILVRMVETRVRLVAIELQEEKANLIQLLLMTGLTLLFTAFGLMSLIALLILAAEPEHRLQVMAGITAALLGLALIGGIWTLVKVRRSTLLPATRRELKADLDLLEDEKE